MLLVIFCTHLSPKNGIEGTRSRSPTLVRALSQHCVSLRPTGIHSRAPTEASRGACPMPHSSTLSSPTGSRLRLPTSAS